MHLDEIKSLFVTRYYRSQNETKVSLEEILNAIDTYSRLPSPSYIAHEDPPGVLGWGSTKSRLKTNAENIVLNVVRDSDWFESLVLSCNNLWGNDAVVHADIKLSNIILGQDSIKIIDWENVSLGNVNWDVAGIIQSLFVEVFTNSKDSPWCRDQLLNLQSSDFSLPGNAIDFLSLRAVQTATELCQNSAMIPEAAVRILELAESTCETGTLEIGRFLNA
jgi:serine/threonine protein kinase